MCRSIRTLRGAEPPATSADVRAAALQFVRKLSGYRTPSAANRTAFDTAVDEVTLAAERLLDGIATRGAARQGTRQQASTANAVASRRRGPIRAARREETGSLAGGNL
jgi:hypothetical protein